MSEKAILETLKEVRNFLVYRRNMGSGDVPAAPALHAFLKPAAATVKKEVPPPAAQLQKPAAPAPSRRESAPAPEPSRSDLTLEDIRNEMGDCRRCELHRSRTNIVFGRGNSGAELMVVEDYPGPREDETGMPLAGEAGELFDKMLAAISLKRSEVYITSLLKCRPPEGRTPDQEEIKACLNHLRRQIDSIGPRILYTLGPLAAKALTGENLSIVRLRGRFHTFHNLPVMPSFHPEFLLRNIEMKAAAWKDLQMIQKKITV